MHRTYLIPLFLLYIFFVAPLCGQVSFGSPEKINDDWKFILNDVNNGQAIELDDASWQRVTLPHDWSVRGQLSPTLASCTGYLPGGIGWYRKRMDIPVEKKGQRVYLYFEGVYNRGEVYINGQLLGKRPNGYISFYYDATPFIQYGEENVIAVRVIVSMPIRAGTPVRVFIVMFGWCMPIPCISLHGEYMLFLKR